MLPLSAMQVLDYTHGLTRSCETQCVDIWLLSARLEASEREIYERVLSNEERERAARFHFQADRDRAIVARGGLRQILSTHIGIQPQGLVFQKGAHGKPSVLESAIPIEFNISHAGDCVLIGITMKDECGVDIEQLRSRVSEEAIAERFFCPREVEWLKRTGIGFVRLWTMKEAIVKAVGQGLSIPLSDVDVTDIAEGNVSAITLNTPGLESKTLWLKELNIVEGYAAAAAAVGTEHTIRLMPEE